MEGIWQTERSAPLLLLPLPLPLPLLLLFVWPNEKTQRTDYAIAVPNLASLVLTHHADGKVHGPSEFKDAHPPVAPLIIGFRIMVGTGALMLLFRWSGLMLYRRRSWLAEALPIPLLVGLSRMSFRVGSRPSPAAM